MRDISQHEVVERLRFDNPWWVDRVGVDPMYRDMPQRAYLLAFEQLVTERSVTRAVILMGPRRVGKTVMVYQTIQRLMDAGVPPAHILYVSLETPLYTGLGLEQILKLFHGLFGHDRHADLYLFFDEIQYLRQWELHLKSLVDSYRAHKFIATGSAAAALRLKSRESGAGRFTEFLLPPLTFAEYLNFIKREDELIGPTTVESGRILELNDEFVRYLNFGGYPEAVFSPQIQAESSRYIKSDIIDKVLLRDLPSLYGISDIQELNRLFTVIAYNTGDEVSLEGLAKSSGVAKNTLKRYLEYLEAAFLIRRVNRIDQHARRFTRATSFKVYLTNPSMRAALFGPVTADNEVMGRLAETAIFSQWFHAPNTGERISYARWKQGEVDLVYLDPQTHKPDWIVEVKWSDRQAERPEELDAVVGFVKQHGIQEALITSRSVEAQKIRQEVTLTFSPAALYCYSVGKNIVTFVVHVNKKAK